MAALNSTINIVYQRRRALYTPLVNRPTLGLVSGVAVWCRVHGCYQVADADGIDVNPYFVIELEDGRCTYASPECIQFVKEEDEC